MTRGGQSNCHLEESYGVERSPEFISNVTNAVIDELNIWQNRPLDKTYPIIYLDALVIKCKEDKRVINKAVYIALGVNMDGKKEILGIWIGENEGAKFWLSIVTEFKTDLPAKFPNKTLITPYIS